MYNYLFGTDLVVIAAGGADAASGGAEPDGAHDDDASARPERRPSCLQRGDLPQPGRLQPRAAHREC